MIALKRTAKPTAPFSDDTLAEVKIPIDFPVRTNVGHTIEANRWQLVKNRLLGGDGLPITANFVNLPTDGNTNEIRFFLYRLDAHGEYQLMTQDELSESFAITTSEGALSLDTTHGGEYFLGSLSASFMSSTANDRKQQIVYTVTALKELENTSYKIVTDVAVDNRTVASDFMIFRVNGNSGKITLR